jgi:hypothetical protein
MPKLTYVLHTTSLNNTQCRKLNAIICNTFLPRLRLNRHFPRAVTYGPIHLEGIAFPEIQAMQCATQLDYFIKQLRWDKQIANNLLVTINLIQLRSGVGTPILKTPHSNLDYVGRSMILSLWRQMAGINASLWIEKIWRHPCQHEHNEFIMDCFICIPRITQAQLKQANEVRIYLRVLTIADLVDPSGRFIPDGNLSGDWQGGSDIHWPHQTKPPPTHWATFQRCMRQTFCKTTSAHQPTHYGMDLDNCLGKWLPVTRHSWFDVYISPTDIFWRIENDIHQLRKSSVPGIYTLGSTVPTLPTNSHPIGFQNLGEAIWTHR